jgi:hypothetical protein
LAEQFDYVGVYVVPSNLPNEVQDIWERSLKAERARILASILSQIGTSEDFIAKLATPSADAWEAFVNPAWPNVDIVTLKQKVKLAASYTAWDTGIDTAFAPAGSFDTNVTSKADKYQNAKPTFGAVGFKAYGGYGPVVKAAMLLNGQTLAEKYMGVNDTLTGHAYDSIDADVGIFSKPTLVALGTQGIVLANLAQSAGLATERDAILVDVNGRIDGYLTKVKKSGVTPVMEITWESGPAHFTIHSDSTTA